MFTDASQSHKGVCVTRLPMAELYEDVDVADTSYASQEFACGAIGDAQRQLTSFAALVTESGQLKLKWLGEDKMRKRLQLSTPRNSCTWK